ncbi:MAG: hypothetical protein AB7D38_12055 [Sulfurimonas sp.]|uniref:hypothetical protein n=1 Tax=Sulfurimonas sp. TaxID=2022749 RepID=UPI003D0C5A8A
MINKLKRKMERLMQYINYNKKRLESCWSYDRQYIKSEIIRAEHALMTIKKELKNAELAKKKNPKKG